jgi:uncharacterized RDD family membrane protein YckC
MRDLHSIRTPENVVFQFELAGVASRALAWGIDLLAMASLISVAAVSGSVSGLVLAGFAKALYFVLAFAIQWGYGATLEWRWHGQTLGKRVVGLRVLSFHGTPITFGQAVVRNLLRIVDILPLGYLVGGMSALCDRCARRLGDIAADTVVVRTRHSARPSAMTAPADRYNSFARDASITHAARAVTAPERDAMLGLSLRREQLPLAVRHALFAKLASHLEARLGIQRPTYFSEERFVLNLTAIALERDGESLTSMGPRGIAG